MKHQDTKFRLTGNPFVDVGLATATCMAGKHTIRDLSQADLRRAVSHMLAEMDGLQRLKVLAQYWQNNPFMGKNSGQIEEYNRTLNDLALKNERLRHGYCQVCGATGVLDINRCWMPLAGSVDSDPCTLPGLGTKQVCSNCFCAIVLLPRGCKLCKTGPFLYHATDEKFLVERVSESVNSISSAIVARASGSESIRVIKSLLSNRLELLDIASRVPWGNPTAGGSATIPADGTTLLSFTNSGTNPRVYWIHLPAQVLEFFQAILEAGVQPVFIKFARNSSDSKYGFHDQLCDDVESRRSFAPILAAIVQSRPIKKRKLVREERLMLQIYEEIAIQRQDRFEALERLADAINMMDEKKRDSFLRQLYNLKTKEGLLKLLVAFHDKGGLLISRADLRIVDSAPWKEIVCLLYLLCVADK
jgi:hypothetical protein